MNNVIYYLTLLVMNKIKLIKSFAGYPVWEYEDYWRPNYRLHKVDLVSIHPDIVEKFKDHFEEVKERPTSWEELWNIDWYYVAWNTEATAIGACKTDRSSIDIFKTKSQALASIALAQITQLLDKYDIPEKSNNWYCSFWDHHRSHRSDEPCKRRWLLRFDTKEKLDHFYKHHKALIDKLAPFYIF